MWARGATLLLVLPAAAFDSRTTYDTDSSTPIWWTRAWMYNPKKKRGEEGYLELSNPSELMHCKLSVRAGSAPRVGQRGVL